MNAQEQDREALDMDGPMDMDGFEEAARRFAADWVERPKNPTFLQDLNHQWRSDFAAMAHEPYEEEE